MPCSLCAISARPMRHVARWAMRLTSWHPPSRSAPPSSHRGTPRDAPPSPPRAPTQPPAALLSLTPASVGKVRAQLLGLVEAYATPAGEGS